MPVREAIFQVSGLRQAARVELSPIGAACNGTPRAPVRKSGLVQSVLKHGNSFREITNDRKITRAHPVKLRGINFKMHDAGIGCEAAEIPGDSVIETRSENQK